MRRRSRRCDGGHGWLPGLVLVSLRSLGRWWNFVLVPYGKSVVAFHSCTLFALSFHLVLPDRAETSSNIYLSAPPPAGDQSAGPGTTLSPQKSNSSSLPTFAIRHAIQANSARVGAGDSSRLVGSMCGHVSCVSSFSPLSINRAFSSSIVASKPRVITHQPFKHAHPTSRHHAARSGGPSPFNTSRSGIAALGYASLVDRDRDSSD